MSRLDDLRRLSFLTILKGNVSWAQQQKLDELLPTHFTAPTGSRIPLRYAAGRAPVLAVRIQEMFGQRDTPKVAHGKIALQISCYRRRSARYRSRRSGGLLARGV